MHYFLFIYKYIITYPVCQYIKIKILINYFLFIYIITYPVCQYIKKYIYQLYFDGTRD